MNQTSSRARSRGEKRSSQTDRMAALWKGLPAAVIAILGLGAIVFASDRNSKLEQRYRRWAEDASRSRAEITGKLNNELKMKQVSNLTNVNVDELIPPDDERRVALDQVTTSERLYYEKLISLNPNEPEYRFQLAAACVNSKSPSDQQRGVSLMLALAPPNQVGYHKAHMWWAEHFMQMIVSRRVNPQAGAEMVFTHSENTLRRLENDEQALRLKAESAMILSRNEDAHRAYSTLFQSEPFYFGELVTLNNRLGRPQANEEIYRRAQSKFEAKLREELPVDQWVRHWEALLTCMAGLRQNAAAADRLRKEIDRQIQLGDAANRIFLEQLLAKTLVSVQLTSKKNSAEFTLPEVELMAEAFRLDSKNLDVLQILTRIAMSQDETIAAAGRKIYDPLKDPAPPALVLNELGAVALARQDYEAAIKYLEQARQKDPRNMMTLNNLAYVYLVSENRNPDRALKLVDDAIRLIPNEDVAKSVLTHFLDTKGTALMQMNRMPEAIAAYELALRDRPEEVKILNALIQCYEASNLSADAYRERLNTLTNAKN